MKGHWLIGGFLSLTTLSGAQTADVGGVNALIHEQNELIKAYEGNSDASDEETEHLQGESIQRQPEAKPNLPPKDTEDTKPEQPQQEVTGQKQEESNSAPSIMEHKEDYTSYSSSQQFRVKGKEPQVCSAVSVKAEEIRKSLIKILKLNPEWKSTITIHLMGKRGEIPPPNPIAFRTNIEGNHIFYNIYVHTGRGINIQKLNQAIITTLLYEITLRNVPVSALPEEVRLPAWIQAGIEQAILWDTDQADRRMYSSMFNKNSVFDIDKLIKLETPQSELDGTSYISFQASAGALILCLLKQDNGQEGVKAILNEAILGSEDSEHLIKRNFPRLSLSPSSLHKWWSLQISEMSSAPLTETMNIKETDQRLTEALQCFNFDTTTRLNQIVSIEDTVALAGIPDLAHQLQEVSNSLVHMSKRAFPSYQPIIVEYAKYVALLQTKKISVQEGQKKLAELRSLRNAFLGTATRVRDYMDWYEINTQPGNTGTFDSYLRTVKLLRNQNSSPRTPLSEYLEDIEKLHLQEANTSLPKLHSSQNK